MNWHISSSLLVHHFHTTITTAASHPAHFINTMRKSIRKKTQQNRCIPTKWEYFIHWHYPAKVSGLRKNEIFPAVSWIFRQIRNRSKKTWNAWEVHFSVLNLINPCRDGRFNIGGHPLRCLRTSDWREYHWRGDGMMSIY